MRRGKQEEESRESAGADQVAGRSSAAGRAAEQPAAAPAEQPAPAAAPEQPTPAEAETAALGPIDFDGGESRLTRLRLPALPALALLLALGGGVAIGYALFDEPGEAVRLPAVAPTLVIDDAPEPEAARQLGFPAFATENTTRVGGSDPIADAAGVALASYPAVGGVGGPRLAVIAPADSWQAALAAGSLAARPIGAPILLGQPGSIPGFTAEALSGLSPTGLKRADGVQVVAIGGVAAPEDLKPLLINGDDPAELAKSIDRERAKLSGRQNPDHILVTSASDPGYAMPAAAWAARSGNPIVFADGDEIPDATTEVIERHPEASVYVLGPESVISDKALKRLERTAGQATRVSGPDPVSNAIEFARFVDGSFGWNINDPGHGFTIANLARPADAGAAAPLAAGGKPGPMLLTDSAEELPRALRNFLLDTKPGYSDDPARAVYNHIWLLGDTSAISLPFQAQVDALTELRPVTAGAGVPDFGAGPGPAEPEQEADPARSDSAGDGQGGSGR